MSSALATSLWIGLAVLNLILLAAVILMLRRTSRYVKRRLKVDLLQHRKALAHRFDRLMWPQVESLISLYRQLDGKAAFPATRVWAASPDFMLHIVEHVRRHRPKCIVECGSGTSTIVLAHLLKALGHDARIFAIENHAPTVEKVREQLRRYDLERFVTLLVVPLVEKRYDGFDFVFNWYDLDRVDLPSSVDLLIVDGPSSRVNACARYPAGPELLPKLSRDAHVFVDDADRPEEGAMIKLWRRLFPDLGIRRLPAEKGGAELLFLDRKVEDFLPREWHEAPGEGSLNAPASPRR
jgi:predicted O-methyltransferase YrrM